MIPFRQPAGARCDQDAGERDARPGDRREAGAELTDNIDYFPLEEFAEGLRAS